MQEKKNYLPPFFKNKEQHPFHIVDRSLLPIWTSQSVFMLILAILYYFHPNFLTVMPSPWVLYSWSLFFFILSLLSWFIQVVIESGQGHHTRAVRRGLRMGMALFIVSEVMFFFAFFWAFFHVSLSPSVAIGCVWPPKGIQPLEIWGLPLVNTLLLLSSGVTITLAHRAILKANTFTGHYQFRAHLFATIILGVTFLCCQWIEYKYGITFTWKENIYGTTFFVTTGFHGLHVIIGTLFLLFCLVRSFLTLIRPSKRIQFLWLLRWRRDSLEKLNKTTLTGWQKIFSIVIPTYIFFFVQYLLMWLKQWPKQRLIVTKLRTDMKTKTNNYRIQKTWKNLQDAIISHITLYIILGINQITTLINKLYYIIRYDWVKYNFTKYQHLGFEAAAWYWHFVDVVWLFLFISIYWWGS